MEIAIQKRNAPLSLSEIREALEQFVMSITPDERRILIIPSDYTRKHSGGGKVAALLYELLKGREVDIMPALGTHVPMSPAEIKDMFGTSIPLERFLVHNWRTDVVPIGNIPGEYVKQVSAGIVDFPIEVAINKKLVNGSYDRIISIGQVLPHEVVGMANYNKNIFVGCGGPNIINKSHFLGAAYGMERLLGKDHSPVREVYDYAQTHFLQDIPIDYILSANSTQVNRATGLTDLHGLFIGRKRSSFEQAVDLSQQLNINLLDEPLNKVVVYLDEKKFKTTWIGCKAVYRTRMAIATGGELVIIAPGLSRFGEDLEIDRLIRKYGYAGRDNVLKAVQESPDLQKNLSAAAHLIHGSADGRFKVTIASDNLTRAEVEGVHMNYMPLSEASAAYPVQEWETGFVESHGCYYINNPATGLWIAKDRW